MADDGGDDMDVEDSVAPHASDDMDVRRQRAGPRHWRHRPPSGQQQLQEQDAEPMELSDDDYHGSAYLLPELDQQYSEYYLAPDLDDELVSRWMMEDRLQMLDLLLVEVLLLELQLEADAIARVQEESRGGFGAAVPASAAAMAALEKRTFQGAGECGGVTECAICLEDGDEVTVMPCFHGHGFHPDCITKWLGRSNSCPLCRHQLPTDVVDGQ